MFLPVILQKDFGNGAWLAFISCNIVGATGFAFFIRSKCESIEFVKANLSACLVFSAVTILFQLLFIGWVLSYLPLAERVVLSLVLVSVCLVVRYATMNGAAIIVWILSALIAASYLALTSPDLISQQLTSQIMHINSRVFYALPLLALGFFLSPYLDLTFHHVVQADRQGSKWGSRPSFLIGFPVLFAMLMLFSLVYIDAAKQMLVSPRQLIQENMVIIKLLFIYFMLQTGFTILAHWQQLRERISKPVKSQFYALTLLAIALPLLLQPALNEIAYRCFMAFYGIIVPAYVWGIAFNKKQIPKKIFAVCLAAALLLSAIPMFSSTQEYYYLYLCAVAVVVALPFLPIKKTS